MESSNGTEPSDDLTSDLPQSRMPDLERIRKARERRKQQVKEWQQYDRKMMRGSERSQRKGMGSPAERGFFRGKQSVKFPQSLIFLEAAARGDMDEVRKLLSEGVCPDVANEDGLTALHQCCIDNAPEMCRLLLRFNANVNARDSEQWTPLHAAAACNHTELCEILIGHNADLLAMNADGNMPYECCCMPGPTLNLIETEMDKRGITQDELDDLHRLPECRMLDDMVALWRTGADLNVLDQQGASWLHIAAACGYEDVTIFLIRNGAKVDLLDGDGWQAIHVAACWNHLEIIEILVNCGADIMATTTSGETVFEICEDLEILPRLLEIKQEAERRKTHENTLTHSDKPRDSIRRRSSTNPRSSSIRRTSMREKKMMSWKEAKQEAEMRGTATLDVVESDISVQPVESAPPEVTQDKHVTSPLTVTVTDSKPSSSAAVSPSGRLVANTTPFHPIPLETMGTAHNSTVFPKSHNVSPTATENGLPRLSNGATSPTTKVPDKKAHKTLPENIVTVQAPININRGGSEGDFGPYRRPPLSASALSRELPRFPTTVPQMRNITRSSGSSDWLPSSNLSPQAKPRARDRVDSTSSLRKSQTPKTDDAVAVSPSPSTGRHLNNQRKNSVTARTEPHKDRNNGRPELTTPNLAAHNAYYTPPTPQTNATFQPTSNRTNSASRPGQSTISRSRNQHAQRTTSARVTSMSRKSKMALIESDTEPQSSNKCCSVM